jgi:glucose/arabinose dehydrogenase
MKVMPNQIYTLLLLCVFVMPSWSGDEIAGLYSQHCQLCHGVQREGAVGPNLADSSWVLGPPTIESLSHIIREGTSDKAMPAWGNILTPGQIEGLASWLINGSVKNNEQGITEGELKKIRLPVDFAISIYADGLANPRSLAVDTDDTVYVGSRMAGSVIALQDLDHDGIAEKKYVIAQGLKEPTGVALHQQNLYVAETSRILRFKQPGVHLEKQPVFDVIKSDLPDKAWHGARAIKIGPDNKMYIPIGAPCNVCDVEVGEFGKIWRMNLDGSEFERVALGVRNSVGLAWHPVTRDLWFTDNGRDELGDNMPSCELNSVSNNNTHFGFPYCHGGSVLDPIWGDGKKCASFTPPVALLGPHVAPLGLSFNTLDQFPEAYKNQLFIAEHGSWNRTQKIGYRISLITLNGNALVSDTVFADFLVGDTVMGRPVDIAWLKDGSMLVSDDEKGRIYRITYTGEKPSKLKKLLNQVKAAL